MSVFRHLYDNTTMRPAWAGTCRVSCRDVTLPGAMSDVRAAGQAGQTVVRPERVEAIVVPLRTPGRITMDVAGRDLSGRNEDRGHVLAYSLGAPMTSEIMIVQGRNTNEEIAAGGERGTPGELSWRAMECYVRFAALMSLMRGESYVPRLDDDVHVYGASQAPTVRVEGVSVTPPEMTLGDYQRVRSQPRYLLLYDARVRYDEDSYRADMATKVQLSVWVEAQGRRTMLLDKDFDTADSFGQYARHAQAAVERRQGRKRARSVADAYKSSKLRRMPNRSFI